MTARLALPTPTHRASDVRLVQRIRRRYAIMCIYTGAIMSAIYAVVRGAGLEPSTMSFHLFLVPAYLAGLWLIRRRVSHAWVTNYLMVLVCINIFADAYYSWTVSPVSMAWGLIVPSLALVLSNQRTAMVWAGITAGLMAITPWVVPMLPWHAEIPEGAMELHMLTELLLPLVALQVLFWGHRQTMETVARSAQTRQVRIEHMRDELVRMQRAKDRFFASVSHELRTPLNAINGLSSLLATEGAVAQRPELLGSLRSASEHLMAIVNDLLDLGKLQEGKLRFAQVDFDLPQTLRAAWGIVRIAAQDKGLSYQLDLADDLPSYVQGDPHRLTQVVVNLLSNAVKFTDAGEVVLQARVQALDAQHVTLELHVRDTGIGIPAAFQKQMFESFTQADNVLTRAGGTGLGLYITRQLLALQQGQISFESQEGKGTTFQVLLPIALGQRAPVPVSAASSAPALHGVRILLVDDNPLNLMVAKLQLEKHIDQVQLHTALDGEEAVQWLADHAVDVVLMDLQMPKLDGYAATEQLRASAEPRLQHLPVIAMTANTLDRELQRCTAAGMNGFVTKPFDIQQLSGEIARVLANAARA